MEHRRLDVGGRQRQEGGARLVGPVAGIVVVRAELADRLGLGVIGLHLGTVERPAGVADARAGLEVDRIEGTRRPTLRFPPVPGGATERPRPRAVQPVGRVADALTPVEPLDATLGVLPAALEQAEADAAP